MKQRIGVITAGLDGESYAFDNVQRLRKEADVIVLHGSDQALAGSTSGLFSLIDSVEQNIVSRLMNGSRAHFARRRIEAADGLQLHHAAGLSVDASGKLALDEAGLKSIKALNLDLIVNTIPSLLSGKALTAASKHGITSLLYGEGRRPVGFWDVFRKNSTSDYAIILEKPGETSPATLYRGNIATERSFTENAIQLRTEANPFLATLSLLLLGTDPSIELRQGKAPPASLKSPDAATAITYAASTFALYAGMAIDRKLIRRDRRWNVAYARQHWQNLDLSQGIAIPNPKHRYFADPFVLKRGGKHYVYVEDYDDRRRLGSISLVVIDDKGNQELISNVILEPFHMSFPFIFEEEGELLMLPETYGSGSIRLYRCIEFPHRWELDTELMRNVSATDTMLVKQGARWFMLTNINQFGSEDHLSQMHVLWADTLRTTNWRRTSPLPAVNSALDGRNGGLLQGKDGAFYRVRQRQGFNRYGAGFSIARITALSDKAYAEETIRDVKPDFLPGLVGTHHMHGIDDFTVFDYARIERYD